MYYLPNRYAHPLPWQIELLLDIVPLLLHLNILLSCVPIHQYPHPYRMSSWSLGFERYHDVIQSQEDPHKEYDQCDLVEVTRHPIKKAVSSPLCLKVMITYNDIRSIGCCYDCHIHQRFNAIHFIQKL